MQTREEKIEWYRQQIELRKTNNNLPALGEIPEEALKPVTAGYHPGKHPVEDGVDHPSYYQGKHLECIDVIDDFQLDFYLGSAVKYILRSRHKGSRIQDLKKAIWYLEREIGLIVIKDALQEQAEQEEKDWKEKTRHIYER